MIIIRYLSCLLLAGLLCPSVAGAGPYVGLSAARLDIDTPAASTYPIAASVYIGYAISSHHLELVFMDGVNDYNLNQLTVGVNSVRSVFYRYSLSPKTHFKIDFILGASQVAINSTYQGVPGSVSDFSGMSYGIGFREAFWSIPSLSLTFDWIQLYHGEEMDINTMNFGVQYEF